MKAVDARYAGQLGPVERTVGVHHETRVDGVTPIGGHPPTARLLLPLGFLYLGLEQGVVVSRRFLPAPRSRPVSHWHWYISAGHKAGLLQHRQINIGLYVAGRAGVAVPIPGAAKTGTLLNQKDIRDAGLLQARRREHTAKAAPDDQHLGGGPDRLPVDFRRDVGIINVVGKIPGHLDVLVIALGANPFVPLGTVLLPQGIGIEPEFNCFGC